MCIQSSRRVRAVDARIGNRLAAVGVGQSATVIARAAVSALRFCQWDMRLLLMKIHLADLFRERFDASR